MVNYTGFDQEENISVNSVYVHIALGSGDTSFSQYVEPTPLLPGVNVLGLARVSDRSTQTQGVSSQSKKAYILF